MDRKLPALLAALVLITVTAACSSSKMDTESSPGKSYVALAPGVTVVHNAMEATKTTNIENLGFREIPEAEFRNLRSERTGKNTPPSSPEAAYVYREYAFVADVGDGIRVKASVWARMRPVQKGNDTVYIFDEIYEDMAELAPASEGAYTVHKNYAKAEVENNTSLQLAVGGYAEIKGSEGTVDELRQFSALQRWNSDA